MKECYQIFVNSSWCDKAHSCETRLDLNV